MERLQFEYVIHREKTIRDQYVIEDPSGKILFRGKKTVLAWTKTFCVNDCHGGAAARIRNGLSLVLPQYLINAGDRAYSVTRKFSLRPAYLVKGLEWYVEGDPAGAGYLGTDQNGVVIFALKRQQNAWDDRYILSLRSDRYILDAFCISLAVCTADADIRH